MIPGWIGRGYLEQDQAASTFVELTDRLGSTNIAQIRILKGSMSVTVFSNDEYTEVSTYDRTPQRGGTSARTVGREMGPDELTGIMAVLEEDAAQCDDDDRVYFIDVIGFGAVSAFAACPETTGTHRNLDDDLAPWESIQIDSPQAIERALAQISRGAPDEAYGGGLGNLSRHTYSLDFKVGWQTLRVSSPYISGEAISASMSSGSGPTFRVSDLDPERIWSCAEQVTADSGSDGWFIDIHPGDDGQPILVWDLEGALRPAGEGNATDQDCQPVDR